MGSNTDGDELRIAADETYDTRSEISSNSSVSSKPSRGDKRSRRNRSKRDKSGDFKSSSSKPKQVRSKEGKDTTISCDYGTKLNYLLRDARFFIIKTNNVENVTLSMAKGVWSTLRQTEAKLNQAYRESRNVLLIFSVTESKKFAGFARLCTESRGDADLIPCREQMSHNAFQSAKALKGGVFKVDWICRKELSFTDTLHLYNSWNDGKRIKIARDGQEIEPRVAEKLCRLFPEDEGIEMTPILQKSKEAGKHVVKSSHYRDKKPIGSSNISNTKYD